MCPGVNERDGQASEYARHRKQKGEMILAHSCPTTSVERPELRGTESSVSQEGREGCGVVAVRV